MFNAEEPEVLYIKLFKNLRFSSYLPSKRCLSCCDSSVGLSRSCIPMPTSGKPAPNTIKYTNNAIMNISHLFSATKCHYHCLCKIKTYKIKLLQFDGFLIAYVNIILSLSSTSLFNNNDKL